MGKTWDRKELKEHGKKAFMKNYWAAVIISVIFAIVTAQGNSNGSDDNRNQSYNYQMDENEQFIEQPDNAVVRYFETNKTVNNMKEFLASPIDFVMGPLSAGFALVIVILAIVSQFLVGNVLEVGCRSFYIENRYSNPGVGRVLSGFRSGFYGNIVKTMFFRDLYIFLWTLLLIIPGIIKNYEYRLVPYFLAENPDMPMQEAFEKSKEMMYGQKLDTFVLDLSFFLWRILSALTLGIAGVFFVNPYMDATNAELYDVLSGDVVNSTEEYDSYNYSE